MISEVLKRAVVSGDISTVKKLTENGRYTTVKNSNGNSLLHIAALCGNYEVSVEIIKNFQEKVSNGKIDRKRLMSILKNRNGKTPLHLAAERGNVAFIKALKETDEKLWELLKKIGDNFGNLPVHTAAAEGQVQVLELFKDQINEKNGEGNTPLHKAVERNRKEAVEFLLLSGANPDVENEHGLKPVDLARFLGFEEITDFFLNHENNWLEEVLKGLVEMAPARDELWVPCGTCIPKEGEIRRTELIVKKILEKEELTPEDWEDITGTLYHLLLKCSGGDALKEEDPEIEGILELIAPKLDEADAVPSELPLVLTLLFPGKFEELMREDFNYLYSESEDEDFRKEALRILRELLIHGKLELSAELYRLPEERIERLPAEIILGGVERLKRIQISGKMEEIEPLRELITEALRELLLSEKGVLLEENLKRLIHGLVELPLLLEPSKENFEVGLLLKELFLKYRDQITAYFERVVDPELPENARPQLLYVVRALVRFLEGCGKGFEGIYSEISFVPEKYGLSKDEFKELFTETAERYIPFE